MNKKITATLSMTREQWGLLFTIVRNEAPRLPKECWEITWEICENIEEALEDSIPSGEYEIEEARQYFKKIVEPPDEEIVEPDDEATKHEKRYFKEIASDDEEIVEPDEEENNDSE